MELFSSDILTFVKDYGYIAAFLFMLFGGPWGSVATGFLAGFGIFKPVYVWLLSMTADLITDVFYYELGRRGGRKFMARLEKFSSWPGVLVDRAERFFKVHGGKTVFIVKFTHGIGAVIQMLAGMSHMRRSTYMTYDLGGAAVRNSLLIALGIFAGSAWEVWMERVEDIQAGIAVMVVLIIAMVWVVLKLQKNLLSNIDKDESRTKSDG